MSCTARASSLPGRSRDPSSRGSRAGRCLALATLVTLAAPAQLAWAAAPTKGAAQAERAPTQDRPPSAPDRAAAQALFDEGRELMEAGRHAEACPRFEESERLEPGLGTRFHLATCYEAVGRLASAHALYLEVAAEAATRKQEARERVARQRAGEVEPKLSRLTIEVPYASSPALRVERDGALVGPAQWGLAVPVDPGKHRINAAAPGRVSWTTEVDVPGDAGVTRVNVPPLAEQRQGFFEPLPRKIGLAALGVGVGTIALGSVFVAQAISKKNASEEAGCDDQSCPDEGSMELRRQALAAGDRATWAMGIGLVGLGAAAALFWVWPIDEDEGDMQLAPVADLKGASLRLSGTF
jgi:hypothetical protein